MEKVEFPFWDAQTDKVITEIYRVTAQCKSVMTKIKTKDITNVEFEIFWDNLGKTLNQWTGHTYVGEEKKKHLQKAFQTFFVALLSFLMECQKLENVNFCEFANKVLYRGVAYRYLGHGHPDDALDKKIEPRYDGIYVSWSKTPENIYIQNKLYGKKTLIICNIDEPYYGIDLEPFDVVHGDEAEVVFPTIKEAIVDVQYL